MSKCLQLCLKWQMIFTLPAHKHRSDNERVVKALGIWSKHMEITLNGEQTDHNSAAFQQC